MAVVGLVGCAGEPAPASFDPLTYADNLDEIEAFWCDPKTPSGVSLQGSADPAAADQWRWGQIGDMRYSAYVLVRGGEATLVDTGARCTSDVIDAGLQRLGIEWAAVGSVVVTHKHPDHWVGLPAVLQRAPDATIFAGAADIPFIASPRPIVAVGDGDRVMDLAIIPTPGHTPGHLAVHDEAAGVLVVGDAIVYSKKNGFDVLPTSEDVPQTRASIDILAGLSFDTLLPGHGDPIIGGAWDALAEYVEAG